MFEKNIDMSLVNLGGDFSTLIPLQEEEEKARKMDVPENLPVLAQSTIAVHFSVRIVTAVQ